MCYHNLSLILEFVSFFGQPVNKLHLPYKGRIQDFPEGATTQNGGAKLLFSQNLPKTA